MSVQSEFDTTPEGRPAGGTTRGRGFVITWQNGPLVDEDGSRKPPNGAFIEDVIQAAKERLEYHQTLAFACEENAEAIDHLKQALDVLEERQRKRRERGVDGTHTP